MIGRAEREKPDRRLNAASSFGTGVPRPIPAAALRSTRRTSPTRSGAGGSSATKPDAIAAAPLGPVDRSALGVLRG